MFHSSVASVSKQSLVQKHSSNQDITFPGRQCSCYYFFFPLSDTPLRIEVREYETSVDANWWQNQWESYLIFTFLILKYKQEYRTRYASDKPHQWQTAPSALSPLLPRKVNSRSLISTCCWGSVRHTNAAASLLTSKELSFAPQRFASVVLLAMQQWPGTCCSCRLTSLAHFTISCPPHLIGCQGKYGNRIFSFHLPHDRILSNPTKQLNTIHGWNKRDQTHIQVNF